MQTKALNIAGLIFNVMAFIHLIRIYFPFQIIIGDFLIPDCASYLAFLGLAALGSWMFLSNTSPRLE